MMIVDPEGERINIRALLIDFSQIFLLKFLKVIDGTGVGPEKPQIPGMAVKVIHRNGRIALQHVNTLTQNELPNFRIMGLVHQIGGGFGKGGERAETF